MSDLRSPLAEQLRDPASELLLQQGWRELELRRRPRRTRQWVWTAPVAFGLAAVVVYLIAEGGRPTALETFDGRPLTAAFESLSPGRELIELSDDSKIRIAPETRVVLGESAPGRLFLVLETGKLDLDVRSRGRTAWRIDAGAITVEVVGTRLSIDRRAREIRVEVFEGKVRVSGSQLSPPVQYLGAGEYFSTEVSPAPESVDPVGALEPELSGSRSVARSRTSPSSPTLEANSPAASAPRREPVDPAFLERRSGAQDLPSAAPEPVDPEVHSRLADEARRRGDPRAAAEHLRVVAAGNDGRAALASLTLGRVLLDELQDAKGAEAAFARALELPLPSAMVEIAWARRVEARGAGGDLSGAIQLAREYHSRFPNGRFARDVDRWSAP